jgi:hypothetical protein
LQYWPHREISLVMDRTDLGRTWSILMVSLVQLGANHFCIKSVKAALHTSI